MTSPFILPDWPAPPSVHSLCTTRHGGVSTSPYTSFNLGQHVGDDPATVEANRQRLIALASLPEPPRWLTQVHANKVITSQNWSTGTHADGLFSCTDHHVCSILTADCLPILLCNTQGTEICALHAGWRSLAQNIIAKACQHFKTDMTQLMAWLGPAIGPQHFEVGPDVYQAFCDHSDIAHLAFKQQDKQHYLADLYQLARQHLTQLGITAIYGGSYCTYQHDTQFFSYRRQGVTGRMASLIWLA